jgi:hypothetical protein
MENIQAFKTSVRRQRFAIVGLATLLAGSVLLGAVSPAGDATFDTITCKEWKVVDKDGKVRIRAGVFGNDVGLALMDKAGTNRIMIFESDGDAVMNVNDSGGKPRVAVSVQGNGNAGVVWYDPWGKTSFAGVTTADGTVAYPTATGN